MLLLLLTMPPPLPPAMLPAVLCCSCCRKWATEQAKYQEEQQSLVSDDLDALEFTQVCVTADTVKGQHLACRVGLWLSLSLSSQAVCTIRPMY
jgi:hypothetical protein